jgi:hypothetical protein
VRDIGNSTVAEDIKIIMQYQLAGTDDTGYKYGNYKNHQYMIYIFLGKPGRKKNP